MEEYLKNKKIKTFFEENIEPQETLMDDLAKKKEEKWGISEKKFETPLAKQKFQGFLIFTFVLFFLLFIRTFQLQIFEGKKYSALAGENKFIIHQIQAERGVIYDRVGNQLVFNRPSFDLIFYATGNVRKCLNQNLSLVDCSELKAIKEATEILKLEFEELKQKILDSQESQILIFGNLSHENIILLQSRILTNELTGFQIERNSIRYYPEGETFSHLIGYTGKISATELEAEPENYSISDWVGRSGIETSYESVLRKNPGKLQIERDALGNIISKEIIQLPESGKSLVLWLDSDLQKKIEESLENGLKRVGGERAAAVALDPKTGGVMALVSLPSFDNNLFQKGSDPEALKALLEDPQKPLFNRAISGGYLTGSTIKPLIALAALEEKIISPEKKNLDDKGLISISNPYNPEEPWIFRDWRIHGWVDMKKAIAESCNVYFYTIGGGYEDQEGLGPTRIKKYLELFGWGDKTQIDLPAEISGLVPDPEWKKNYFERKIDQIWYDGDTYNFSIGQGFLKVTPLQVASSFVAIANGGKLYQPLVVQKIVDTSEISVSTLSQAEWVDSEKNLIEELQPKLLRENFIDLKNLEIVREGMRQAVTGLNSPYASATLLNSLPVSAAAKTGTAEIWKKGEKLYLTWVTVFAPYEDPEIVLTIMIEDVKDLSTLTVLPVAKEALEWYFAQQ